MTDTAYEDEVALSDVLERYGRAPHDPEVLTDTFREIWRHRGKRIGADPYVPPCPYSSDEIAALEAEGRVLGYLPPSLASQATRPLLGDVFPAMDDFVLVPDNSLINDVDRAGWFDYEVAIDSPLQGLDPAEVTQHLEERGQVLLTINQYIIAAQDSRLLRGHYIDEGLAWSRTGSTSDGRLMAARFDGAESVGWNVGELHLEGCLVCGYDVGPDDKGDGLGARSTTRWSEVAEPGVVTVEKPVLPFPVVDDLDAEWERIVALYIGLGFHEILAPTQDQYRASLPRLMPQPMEYQGRFGVPLVVETRIAWEEQAAAAGV